MDGLQYLTKELDNKISVLLGFKPCYKRNTFNTSAGDRFDTGVWPGVLNLVISEIPSIQLKLVLGSSRLQLF